MSTGFTHAPDEGPKTSISGSTANFEMLLHLEAKLEVEDSELRWRHGDMIGIVLQIEASPGSRFLAHS
jgi:hypothetical protein